jgi:hypothetical protein
MLEFAVILPPSPLGAVAGLHRSLIGSSSTQKPDDLFHQLMQHDLLRPTFEAERKTKTFSHCVDLLRVSKFPIFGPPPHLKVSRLRSCMMERLNDSASQLDSSRPYKSDWRILTLQPFRIQRIRLDGERSWYCTAHLSTCAKPSQSR